MTTQTAQPTTATTAVFIGYEIDAATRAQRDDAFARKIASYAQTFDTEDVRVAHDSHAAALTFTTTKPVTDEALVLAEEDSCRDDDMIMLEIVRVAIDGIDRPLPTA